MITRFENQQYLEKVGEGMFAASDLVKEMPEPNPNEFPGYKVHQGKIEHSNSNVVQEMINSITGLRLYEALQKNIHLQNEALGKAVNEVGRFR